MHQCRQLTSRCKMINVPDPCCIPLHTCVKISATASVILAIGVIIVQGSMIHSANRIHDSAFLPLYKILRTEYYIWKNKIDADWSKMRKDMSTSSAERIERMLKLQLAFSEDEGIERRMMKEKSIRDYLELPNLPDYTEIQRVSYICGLNGLFGGILQLCASFSLLWTVDKGNTMVVKIWIAVTGGVIFSLTTCLLALLLQDNPVNLVHMTPSAAVLFPVLGIDLLLTLYFLWIILAYLYQGANQEKRYFV